MTIIKATLHVHKTGKVFFSVILYSFVLLVL